MKFLFHLHVFLSLLALTSNAQVQPQTGCSTHKTILICSGELPYGDDLQSPDLQTLVMSKLPEGTWLSLENPQLAAGGIQKIEIQRSSLGKVEPGYFASVSGKNKLKRLSFRNVDGSVVVDKNMLKGLEKSLNYLTVINGLTVNIADLADMEYLTDLELMSTKIIGTPADFEKLIPQLRSLEIKKCNLNQLPWEALAKWVANSETKRLRINDNHWICDCPMMKLKRLQPSVLESELQKITCAGPANLMGKQLSELTEKDLCPDGELELNQSLIGGSLEASGSTSGDGRGGGSNSGDNGSNGIGGSSGSESEEEKGTNVGVRTEVIIAGSVVGILVLAFVAFLIVYKCQLFPKSKSREERASRTHQNKRYVNVIEEPPLQQFGTNGLAKQNGKYSEGAPV
ncbi:unnamed protein product [Hymenolepis diminuta]|uniref:LRRCT domain-containing protein n=1 Tax=Hymenolepis diminuta TaxID=6216 RepID=A0A0R3SDF0_HYMDI|nr:unnamed protein product [Hymenolepis diminuta]VUZ44788.1 unnamed protein product [Hymenolepis diminuta]